MQKFCNGKNEGLALLDPFSYCLKILLQKMFCQLILPSMLRAGGASLGVVIYNPKKEIIHGIWEDCSGLGQIQRDHVKG